MVSFDDFRINHPDGSRIGDDSLVANHEETEQTKYQCASLVKQYIRECYGLQPGYWGNAIDYWTHTSPTLLQKFSRVNDGTVSKGDIAIFNGINGNIYGHIGIATGNGDPNSIEVLEQNGVGSGTGLGQDAIRTRFIPRNRLAGVLRPVPQTPEITFQRTAFSSPKWVQPRAGVHKWDLNLIHPTFQAVVDNWIDTATGEPRKVQGTLVRSDFPQYQYYLEDINQNYGWNVLDAPDYTPPVPPPPAAPVAIPLAEKYTLVTTVMYFPTAKDAQERRPTAISSVDKGEYYVVGRDEQAVKLSKDNKSDIGWVNTFDNKVEQPKPVEVPSPAIPTLPVDPPPAHDEVVDVSSISQPISDITPNKPKPQYQWINNHAAQTMVSTNSIPITVRDLEGKYPDLQFPPNWRGEFSMYANVGGVTYYIPDKVRKSGWFYGVPETMLRPVQQAKLDLNNDGRVNIADAIGIGGFIMTESKRAYTRLIAPVITDLRTEKAVLAKAKITKAIDGFSAGRKGKK